MGSLGFKCVFRHSSRLFRERQTSQATFALPSRSGDERAGRRETAMNLARNGNRILWIEIKEPSAVIRGFDGPQQSGQLSEQNTQLLRWSDFGFPESNTLNDSHYGAIVE